MWVIVELLYKTLNFIVYPRFVAYNPLIYIPFTYIIFNVLGGVVVITKKLGIRIRELRNQAGISQEKFALSIEMDRTYFASVEAGKRNIAICNIKKIADGLNISLSELFKGL